MATRAQTMQSMRARIEELEDENAVLLAQRAHIEEMYKLFERIGFDCVSVTRAEGRYLSEKTLEHPLYTQSGARADDYHNFTTFDHGFWSGALATSRLMRGNDSISSWKRFSKIIENGDKVKMPTACEQLQNIVNCGLLPFDITCDEVCSELRLGAMCVRMPDKNKIAEVLHMNRTLDEKLGMVHADSKSAIEEWPMLDT